MPDPFRQGRRCASPPKVSRVRIEGIDHPVKSAERTQHRQQRLQRDPWVTVLEPSQRARSDVRSVRDLLRNLRQAVRCVPMSLAARLTRTGVCLAGIAGSNRLNAHM